MRRLLLAIVAALGSALFLLGCGNGSIGFGQDGGADADLDATAAGDHQFNLGDGAAGDGGCVNLQCQQTCASTSISGTVYDPAGKVGLYNVFVYVPNTALDPIPDGPTCTACQAPASGNPVVSATTDANGKFTIPQAPDGQNIPIVLQLGKWRRHLTIANVTKCVDNPQPDGSLRLARKQHESSPDDNIPLIAMTTGCDAAECFFMSRIGIDPSEFTGSNGTGRVRVYKSADDDGQTFSGIKSGALTATQLWNNAGEMLKYDIVFDACECNTFTRGTNGYKNILGYLNAGGRAFATHYFYNFFASQTQCGFDATCNGQTPLPTVGAWEANQGLADSTTACKINSQDFNGLDECLNIDTAVPKGKAFADWYAANNAKIGPTYGGEQYGYVGLTDIRNDMGKLDANLVNAGTATPWLYAHGPQTFPTNYDAYYFSFNTPVGTNTQGQCGRAIFSDVHLAETPPADAFPTYCPSDPNMSDHAPNELALEFLFFDLASCVQNDTQAPVVPH
ncbi:MAG TPA: carboxypeptidase-like regulatory domain-containing protein [Polyangiaceae bacterium]|jgi:hypothetical protein